MSLYPEWELAHHTNDPIAPQLKTMWNMFGKLEGKTCGECKHLYAKQYAGTYYKCGLTKDTRGPASDWRKKWGACGKWEVTDDNE